MVKGASIKPRDTIQRNNVNYRELSALNCSMIKLFDTDPVKFFEQFKLGRKKEENKNTSLLIGDIVDFYLLDCRGNEDEFNNRFEEKFALFEGTKGTGQAFLLADILFKISQDNTDENGVVKLSFDTMFSEALVKIQEQGKYKGATEEKALEDFYKKGYDYYESLVANAGKLVVDVSLLDKAKRVADLLKDDEFTKDVFADSEDENVEYFPKFAIEWEAQSSRGRVIKCKSEVDILRIDHKKKRIYPKDLKTTYDNENFNYSYLKYRYDLQAAFYTMAVHRWATGEGMGSYTIEPFEFIVGDTSANNRRPVRYQLTTEDIKAARDGFSIRGVKYKGINQLIDEIVWAEDNDMWNCSKEVFDNDGKLKLEIQYD